jgi:hypothetical protein
MQRARRAGIQEFAEIVAATRYLEERLNARDASAPV